MSPPILSIITVSYNSLAGLRRTNASLNFPPGFPVETMLIDGLSTDGTSDFMESAECRYSVRVREKDGGIYDAMNKGIARATGKYLLFLNCGDCLAGDLPWDRLKTNLEQNLAVSMGNLVAEDGGKMPIRTAHFQVSTFVRFAWPHQASFIPRAFFEELGAYDTRYRVSADQEWFVRALVAKKPFLALGFDIAVYEGGGLSDRPESQKVIAGERKAILNRHLGLPRAFALRCRISYGEFQGGILHGLKKLLRRAGWN